jgi:hypothetical protein
MPGSSIRALLLNVSLPECRGTAFAIFNLMDDLGKGLGPFLVSLIIQMTGSREEGLLLSVAAWALQSVFLFAIAFVIDDDVAKTESILLTNYLNSHPTTMSSRERILNTKEEVPTSSDTEREQSPPRVQDGNAGGERHVAFPPSPRGTTSQQLEVV